MTRWLLLDPTLAAAELDSRAGNNRPDLWAGRTALANVDVADRRTTQQ
jgi:hypothetical protein